MAHTFQPFADLEEIPFGVSSSPNVSRYERLISVAGGAALALYGATRRSLPGALLALAGGLLVHRGATGTCQLYQLLGVDTSGSGDGHGVPGDQGIRVEKSLQVARPPMELYHFWRRLENLPTFMPHLQSVQDLGNGRSHWVVNGPAGKPVAWDAEVINDEPGALIAWQSLPGAEVRSAGSVRFAGSADNTATTIFVKLEYLPPAGRVGALVARLLGASPDRQLEEDLALFKAQIEAMPVEGGV